VPTVPSVPSVILKFVAATLPVLTTRYFRVTFCPLLTEEGSALRVKTTEALASARVTVKGDKSLE